MFFIKIIPAKYRAKFGGLSAPNKIILPRSILEVRSTEKQGQAKLAAEF